MHSFVLTDWVTIRGASATAVVQAEPEWLDLSSFQDLVAWIDVREASGAPAPQLYLETAPAKDDVLFVSMNGSVVTPVGYTMTASTTPLVASLFMISAPTPLARFVRWKIIGPAGAWDATFRILLAANSPGLWR